VAVGAFGRKGLAPSDSVSASDVGRLGKDKRNFMADCSNRGAAIDFAGPGVGIVSTVPVDRCAVTDGTAMASPARRACCWSRPSNPNWPLRCRVAAAGR